MLLVASPQPLLALHLAPIELRPVVSRLEPEAATILTDSITLDVHPPPFPSVESSAHVVVVNNLPLFPDLQYQDWTPDWESHPGEPYQLATVILPMNAVPTGQRRY